MYRIAMGLFDAFGQGPGSGGRSSPLAFAAHVLRKRPRQQERNLSDATHSAKFWGSLLRCQGSDRQFLLAALALDTEALVYASEVTSGGLEGFFENPSRMVTKRRMSARR